MLAVQEDLEQHAEPSIIHPWRQQKSDVVPCHVLKQTCMLQVFYIDTVNIYRYIDRYLDIRIFCHMLLRFVCTVSHAV